jgi:hypothetical protein
MGQGGQMHHNPADEMLAELGAEPLNGSGFENDEPEAVYEETDQNQRELAK